MDTSKGDGRTDTATDADVRGRPKRVITEGTRRRARRQRVTRPAGERTRADINNERALSNAPRETTNSGRRKGRRAGEGRRVIYGAARARVAAAAQQMGIFS